MPLSEHEQRLLEQMEQALSVEDPKFASAMRGAAARTKARRRIIIGAFAVLVGLALVLLGVARGMVIIGVLGFAVMVAGAWLAITPPRRKGPVGAVAADGTTQPHSPRRSERRGERRGAGGMTGNIAGSGAAPRGAAGGRGSRAKKQRGGKGAGRGGFMARIEQRWERRRGRWDA